MVDGPVLLWRARTAGGGWPRATHIIKLRPVAPRGEFAKRRSKFCEGSQEFHDRSLSLRLLEHEPAGLDVANKHMPVGPGSAVGIPTPGKTLEKSAPSFAFRKAGPAAIKFPWIGSKMKYT